MFNYKSIAAGAMMAVVAAAGASADTYKKYGEVGHWNVFIDETKGSCLIETRQTEGLIVQMGLNKAQTLGYLGVFTQDPTGFKKGDKRQLIIELGSDVYTAESTAMKGNITPGYSGAYIPANNPNFIADVANKQTLKAVDTDQVFTLDLTDTKNAMEMGRECNAAQK